LKKSGILQTSHSALDVESNNYNNLEIPACAGMTFLVIFSKVSNDEQSFYFLQRQSLPCPHGAASIICI